MLSAGGLLAGRAVGLLGDAGPGSRLKPRPLVKRQEEGPGPREATSDNHTQYPTPAASGAFLRF